MPQKKKNGSQNAPVDNEEPVDNFIPTPPDGGWGWVIVGASLCCNIIVDGIGYTFGVFLLEFVRFFQLPKSVISLCGSVQMGIYLCAGPIVSALTNKFGCRPVCITGSIISFIAFGLATLSPNIQILILTYGVMAGFGFGMMYLPAIVSVGFYFEKKRALATGLAVCGSGIGTFIFAPFSKFLLDEFNWKGALLILAGIVLNGVIAGALMRPLKATKKSQNVPTIEISEVKDEKAPEVNGASNADSLRPAEDGSGVVVGVYPQKDFKHPALKETGDAFFSSVPNILMSSATSQSAAKKRKGKEKRTKKEDEVTQKEMQSLLDSLKVEDVENRVRRPDPSPASLFLSDANVNRIKQDLARPMYRKDIFYSGSIAHIPQYKSQQDMRSYIRSVTSIASIVQEEGDNCFARCTCIPKPARDTLGSMLDCSLLKNVNFQFILLGNIIAMLGYYVPFIYLIDRAVMLGINEERAALLVSIIGIMNILGRILAGLLADRRWLDSLLINNIAMMVCGVITGLGPFFNTYATLCVFATVFGLGVATYISLTSIIICDILGLENLTNAFGLLTLARGVSSIAGPPLAGAVFDSTGNLDISFYMGGALIILGALCHMILHLPCLRRLSKQQKEKGMPEEIDIGEKLAKTQNADDDVTGV